MLIFRLHRLLPPAAAILLAGCGLLKGPLGDESDDLSGTQTQPMRQETPSLLGPGSERVQSGNFPVIHFDGDNWKVPASEQSKVKSIAKWFAGHPELVGDIFLRVTSDCGWALSFIRSEPLPA